MVGGMQGGVNREGMVSPMPVRRDKSGRWRYREMVRLPDGTRERISGTAPKRCNTKVAAQQAMLDHIDRLLHPERAPKPRKEVPTFKEWFEGRFWHEWVVSRKNKPSEVESKRSIFRVHLADAFGELPLDEIDVATIARFRATLIQANKSDKTINNILAVLSKALKYAEQAQVIARAPAVGLLKVERPEIVAGRSGRWTGGAMSTWWPARSPSTSRRGAGRRRRPRGGPGARCR
jgi:hypothetical protein